VRFFELFIGLRYTRTRRSNGFISFISATSMLGIVLGVTALITVLSVMNGFQTELRTRILGVASHIQIEGVDSAGLADWTAVAADSARHPEVQGAAPYVSGQGMLAFGSAVQGVLVRGILPEFEPKVSDLGTHLRAGRLGDLVAGRFGIILGRDLAAHLGARVGDKIVLLTPQGQVTPAGLIPRLKQFTVVGIFEAGMFEYDNGLALIHLEDAQKLFRLENRVSGVRLRLRELFAAPRVARELTGMLHVDAWINDWTREHANFFRAVAIEKTMMFVILMLIVAVAAFNIVSTLVMAVTDKRADIAILRTLGARPGSITAIFMVQGATIGFFGTLLGAIGGIVLALNVDVVVPFIEHLFGIQFLARDVYYISELPSELQWSDVAVVCSVSFVLTLLATLYPSWRASRVLPAEALRHE
jgi:lipoprotein-releasing system permease protein